MSEVQTSNWSETAASNNATPPNGWPEGQAPSTVNDCARELMAAVRRWFGRWHGIDESEALISSAGTSTAITVTYSNAPASLFTGLECGFKVTTTCGADPTLNINALGAKNIQKFVNGAYANLIANDIVATQHVKVKYDGTLDKWILMGSVGDTTLAYSTYTPTLTNVTNVAASTAFSLIYARIGNTVHVSGRANVDPTASAAATELGISLPIASNFASLEDCTGVGGAPAFTESAGISADTTNDRASLQFVSATLSNHAVYFHFTYRIL